MQVKLLLLASTVVMVYVNQNAKLENKQGEEFITELDQRIIYESSFIFLQVIAENLSEEEIIGLKEMFKSMDIDNSGTITFEELKAGLPKLGTKVSESEVRQLMEAVRFLLFCLIIPQHEVCVIVYFLLISFFCAALQVC